MNERTGTTHSIEDCSIVSFVICHLHFTFHIFTFSHFHISLWATPHSLTGIALFSHHFHLHFIIFSFSIFILSFSAVAASRSQFEVCKFVRCSLFVCSSSFVVRRRSSSSSSSSSSSLRSFVRRFTTVTRRVSFLACRFFRRGCLCRVNLSSRFFVFDLACRGVCVTHAVR